MIKTFSIWLPTSDIIISALEKIVKAFENSTQIDLIRQRWEEIKKLQDSKEILSSNLAQDNIF